MTDHKSAEPPTMNHSGERDLKESKK